MKHTRPKYYPSWVFSVNENVTRANMREFDRQEAAIDKRCLVIAPDYPSRSFREKYEIRRQAHIELGF